MSPLVLSFLQTALAPSVVAALLILLTGGISEPARTPIQATIWALSFAAGGYLLLGQMSFPPSEPGIGWTCSALALAVFVWLSPRALGTRYGLRAVFVIAAGVLTFWQIRTSLNPSHYRNLAAFFCLGLGLWSITEGAYHKVSSLTLMALPLISATGLSLLMLFSASASMAQMVSIACALMGAMAAVALFFPQRLSALAIVPFLSVLVALFMASGHFFLNANPWRMIMMAIPFLVLWIRSWIPAPKNPIGEAIVLSILAAAPVGYIVWNVYKTAGPLY